MDFNKPYVDKHNYGKYERIDPNHLPKIYLAYKIQLSKVSGKVLNTIKQKYDSGDELVHNTLSAIAELAVRGKELIIKHDYDELNELINLNFDLRTKIMNISESNLEMIRLARECGASAKFSGSGGAIIGIYKDDEILRKLIVSLKKVNARVIKPYIL